MTRPRTVWWQVAYRIHEQDRAEQGLRAREESAARQGHLVWFVRCVDGVYRDHHEVTSAR